MNVIEENTKIGKDVFIGNFVMIRTGSTIGDNCVIGHNTTIEENVTIGTNVRIQANCYITKGTVIEDNVFIAPSVSTYNDKFICSHGRPEKSPLKAPLIKKNSRIGGGSNIGPEVIIGENSMVGCGSLVIKDVPDYELWYGVPAKRVRIIPADEII